MSMGGMGGVVGSYNFRSGVNIEDWAGGRGFQAGGYAPAPFPSPYHTNEVQYFTITNLSANATDFGNLSSGKQAPVGISQKSRLLMCGGRPWNSGAVKTVDRFNPDSHSNATGWGDLYQGVAFNGGNSNGTRGVIMSGNGNPSTGGSTYLQIQYMTILTDASGADFGDMNNTTGQGCQGYAKAGIQGNDTRSVIAGGEAGATSGFDVGIGYVTTATTGNAVAFGDLNYKLFYAGGCSNATRAMFFGNATPNNEEKCQYITVATTGNATTFADMPTSGWSNVSANACASNGSGDIGISMGNSAPYASECCSKTISTTANAVNFGNLIRDMGYGSQGAAGGS